MARARVRTYKANIRDRSLVSDFVLPGGQNGQSASVIDCESHGSIREPRVSFFTVSPIAPEHDGQPMRGGVCPPRDLCTPFFLAKRI